MALWKIPGSATLPTPPATNGDLVTWARAFTGAVADLYRVIAEQFVAAAPPPAATEAWLPFYLANGTSDPIACAAGALRFFLANGTEDDIALTWS